MAGGVAALSLGRAAVMACGEIVAVLIVLFRYPETAHRDLDELNPEPAI